MPSEISVPGTPEADLLTNDACVFEDICSVNCD